MEENKDELLEDIEEELTFQFREFDYIHAAFRKKETKIRKLTNLYLFLFSHKIDFMSEKLCMKISILTYELQGLRIIEQSIEDNIREINSEIYKLKNGKPMEATVLTFTAKNHMSIEQNNVEE